MKLVLNLFLIIGVIFSNLTFATEDVYQWKDDKGITHFTQTPPLDKAYKVIKGKEEKFNPSNYRSNTRVNSNKMTQATSNAASSEIERYQATRKHNCKVAQKNLLTLTNVARIRVTGSDGKERLLTDTEKADKIKLSQQQVKNFCSKEFNKDKSLFPDPNDPNAPRQDEQ